MNYIAELNAFAAYARNHPKLSSSARLLWRDLMQLCNESLWANPFSVTMAAITEISGLNRKTILKARYELRELGLIDYNEESGKPTIYRIIPLSEPSPKTDWVEEEPSPKTDWVAVQKRTGSDGDTINIKTKNNISFKSNLNNSDLNKAEKNEQGAKEDENFKRFYDAYPRHQGRKPAKKAWDKLHPSAELTETIISHVEKRKKTDWNGKDKTFIPLPATFLNNERWTDELAEPARKIDRADRPIDLSQYDLSAYEL